MGPRNSCWPRMNYKLNRLLTLNEELVRQASHSTVKPDVPVSVRTRSLPVKPIAVWSKTENYIEKTYEFSDASRRNMFLFQLLGMEEDRRHNAEMLVKEKSVKIRLTTKDVNKVTELDQEYSHAADAIYAELINIHDK